MPIGGTSALRAATIAFTTAGATLAAQILFHRIISAKLLNNYAFLVISLTMLGFASSGVILSRYLSRWLDRFNDIVALWTALFVLSSVGSSLIFYHAAMSRRPVDRTLRERSARIYRSGSSDLNPVDVPRHKEHTGRPDVRSDRLERAWIQPRVDFGVAIGE